APARRNPELEHHRRRPRRHRLRRSCRPGPAQSAAGESECLNAKPPRDPKKVRFPMYIPAHFAAGRDAIHDLLTRPGAANLVTMTAQGLLATFLPFIYDPSIGEHGALHGHLARTNPQWSEPAIGESLAIIQGADAYISPSWYASKAEH